MPYAKIKLNYKLLNCYIYNITFPNFTPIVNLLLSVYLSDLNKRNLIATNKQP